MPVLAVPRTADRLPPVIPMKNTHAQGVKCAGCGEAVPSYDIVHYGSIDHRYRKLCSQCFNADVAERSGVEDFENIRLAPIMMTDCKGDDHQFHLRTHLLGDMVTLEAFELHEGSPGGYQFELIGDPDDDLFALLGRLVQKIRKTLSVKHIEHGDLGLHIIDQTVRGRIESSCSDFDSDPIIVVDGQEISWTEFGRMLMSFEGWQIKLEIVDVVTKCDLAAASPPETAPSKPSASHTGISRK